MYTLINFMTKENEEEVLVSTDNGEICSFINLEKNQFIPINMNKDPMNEVIEHLKENADEITFIHEDILNSFKETCELLYEDKMIDVTSFKKIYGYIEKNNETLSKSLYPFEKINKQILEKTINAFESYTIIQSKKQFVIVNKDFYVSKDNIEEVITEILEQSSIYNNYADALKSWVQEIYTDIHDLGLYPNGTYDFYLTQEELIYLGFKKELEKQLNDLKQNSVDDYKKLEEMEVDI